MKRVLTAAVLAPVVLLIVFRAPLWLFAVVIIAIILLALHEYLAIAEAAQFRPFKWLAYLLSLLPFALHLVNGLFFSDSGIAFSTLFLPNWMPVLTVGAVALGTALVFRKDLRTGMASAGISMFGVIYIAVSLSLLIYLRAESEILLPFILFSVWAGDIAAYYVGKNFGRHKLAPVVSPNKSWEGAAASVIASIAVAFLIFHFRAGLDSLFSMPSLGRGWTFYAPPPLLRAIVPVHIVTLGILTNIAAQFGDLFESALKRGAGVKDSGTLLPGHGGILDRIDALLFAIPVVWYYAQLTQFLAN
jgi:phosphatidate cytidylyltransferase